MLTENSRHPCSTPLPKQIDTEKVLEAISPDKDVDGFHPYNVVVSW